MSRVDQHRRTAERIVALCVLSGPGKALRRAATLAFAFDVGYGSKTVQGSEMQFTEGFVGPNDSLTVSDIEQRINGPAYTEVDGFIGYSRRIWQNRIGWRVQLNIRNLFDNRDRIPQRVLSTGELAIFTFPDERHSS